MPWHATMPFEGTKMPQASPAAGREPKAGTGLPCSQDLSILFVEAVRRVVVATGQLHRQNFTFASGLCEQRLDHSRDQALRPARRCRKFRLHLELAMQVDCFIDEAVRSVHAGVRARNCEGELIDMRHTVKQID